MGLAIEGNGNVYGADMANCRIQVFDFQGRFLLKWDAEGREDFDGPCDLALDNEGNVYVANDTVSHHRILVFKQALLNG